MDISERSGAATAITHTNATTTTRAAALSTMPAVDAVPVGGSDVEERSLNVRITPSSSGGHASDEDGPTVSDTVNLTQFSVYQEIAPIIYDDSIVCNDGIPCF